MTGAIKKNCLKPTEIGKGTTFHYNEMEATTHLHK
jgi:hypothetical protein